MTQLLNAAQPVVYSDGTMQQHFRDYLRRVETSEVDISATADYSTTGLYGHEIVVCDSASPITVTLHTLKRGSRVTVIRAGTGAVTIDGDGTNITGSPTQSLPSQYDAAELIGASTEWVLM